MLRRNGIFVEYYHILIIYQTTGGIMNFKLLLELIGNLSSFATLHTWLEERYQTFSNKRKIQELETIDIDVIKQIKEKLTDDYEIEQLNDFIIQHSSEFKSSGLSMLFSDAEKKQAIDDYLKKHPTYYRKDVTKALNEYFNILSDTLNNNLSFETKYIKKCINQESDRIIESFGVILDNKLSSSNTFEDSVYSNSIISSCVAINSLLLDNLKIELWNKTFKTDYLIAGSLEDIISRLEKLINSFNVEDFNKYSSSKESNPVESLIQFVLKIAPDLSVKLNYYYAKTIIPTIKCIYGFTDRNKDFYISIGALGLSDDNSEPLIFSYIMNNLTLFFKMIFEVLNELWKERHYEDIEEAVCDQINKNIYHRIRWCFNDTNRKMLKIIYERGSVIDTDLAAELGCDIIFVRKNLYNATKMFLEYSFVDKRSTNLSISKNFKETINKYYNELFSGV
jgi:hypothetical protein